MAIDLGEKRIGIALSDPARIIASGYAVINRTSRKSDFEKIGRIILEQNVDHVVVGLPTLPSGEEGSKAAWARSYASDLSSTLGVRVNLWDESLTTIEAESSLRSRGVKKDRQKERIDAVAAAFILQSYLDAVREGEPWFRGDET
jgi:putative Holliday junction resolvase